MFTDMYKNKLKQVCANLIPNSYVQNKTLISRLKNGEFKPHEIAFVSPCELFPERWEKIIEEKKKGMQLYLKLTVVLLQNNSSVLNVVETKQHITQRKHVLVMKVKLYLLRVLDVVENGVNKK